VQSCEIPFRTDVGLEKHTVLGGVKLNLVGAARKVEKSVRVANYYGFESNLGKGLPKRVCRRGKTHTAKLGIAEGKAGEGIVADSLF